MKLNGKDFELSILKNRSISSILTHFQILPGAVAIEMNGDMVERERWEEPILGDGDSIEIIKFVGGG